MPTRNETKVCLYLKDCLAGYYSEIIEAVPGQLRRQARPCSGRSGLVFMSHTDVVPVEKLVARTHSQD